MSKGAKLVDALLFPSFENVNFQIIKDLLKRGANPKATDYFGNGLFHQQCQRGNLKNVKYLIQQYNADVSAKNKQGQTPLHLACAGWNINLKMVKFLIEEQNADPAVTCNEGQPALHYAAKNIFVPNIIRYLIDEHQLDIEATDNEGRTALHIACQSDALFKLRWSTQKYLIEDHPKIIEAKDKKGKTALYYCLEHSEKKEKYKFDKFRPIALILATKANILKTQENKVTDLIFHRIKQSYDSDTKKGQDDEAVSCLIAGLNMFQKQLDKKDGTNIENNPLLLIVSICNRVDIAEYMFNKDLCYIKTHFNAEEANSKRKLLLKSYLEFSCKNDLLGLTKFLFKEINNRRESFQHLTFDGSLLRSACRYKYIEIFKYLLEDEETKDEAAEFLKDFPLYYACGTGSLEMVQYLIEIKQFDIEEKDTEGRTPLHLACHSGSIEIAKYLIETQNANTNTTDNKGRSVWHFACKSNSFELVKYISQKAKQDVNAQDEDGSTKLHLACERRNLKVVKFLITDMKADLHSVDKEGGTPLHVACQSVLPKVSIVRFLVNQGANVLAKDNSGRIPLQISKNTLKSSDWKTTENIELIIFLKAATKR